MAYFIDEKVVSLYSAYIAQTLFLLFANTSSYKLQHLSNIFFYHADKVDAQSKIWHRRWNSTNIEKNI